MNEPAKPPSEQGLRHMYDDAAVGLCYFDADLRYVHINKWLAQLNGLPIEKHLGRPVRQVIPEIAAGIEDQLRQVMGTNTPIIEGTVEAETPAQPGVRRTFMHNYFPVTADNGEVIGVSCLVQDITARRNAEVGLKASMAELGQANGDLQRALDNVKELKALRDSSQKLTMRQREVLQLLAEGRSMKEAAATLEVTPRTIAFHKYGIMKSFGLETNADLVKYAIKHGIVATT